MQHPMSNATAIARKYLMGRQGWTEGLTIRQTMDLLQQDPEARREFMREFIGRLNKGARDAEGERAGYIKEMNDLVGVNWDTPDAPPAGLPKSNMEIDGFKPRPEYPTVGLAHDAVFDWVFRRGPGLVTLSGPPGVGKTHLAAAAAAKLQTISQPVMYRMEARLIGELQQAMKGGDPEAIITHAETVPWLIIDELGGAAAGDWGRGVIDRLINARWENSGAVRTLITTNLTGEELPPRIASRLRDKRLARVVTIKASDYRSEIHD